MNSPTPLDKAKLRRWALACRYLFSKPDEKKAILERFQAADAEVKRLEAGDA